MYRRSNAKPHRVQAPAGLRASQREVASARHSLSSPGVLGALAALAVASGWRRSAAALVAHRPHQVAAGDGENLGAPEADAAE